MQIGQEEERRRRAEGRVEGKGKGGRCSMGPKVRT